MKGRVEGNEKREEKKPKRMEQKLQRSGKKPKSRNEAPRELFFFFSHIFLQLNNSLLCTYYNIKENTNEIS
jgi:hypothetical protein